MSTCSKSFCLFSIWFLYSFTYFLLILHSIHFHLFSIYTLALPVDVLTNEIILQCYQTLAMAKSNISSDAILPAKRSRRMTDSSALPDGEMSRGPIEHFTDLEVDRNVGKVTQ